MADNKKLQFKMGEWTNQFDSMDKAPGTVYITTNEKAMYVDVDENTRIRIGDIIQVNSAKTAQPPFSTEALYYFITENALMKWDGTKWNQLNSTAEVTTAVNELKTKVNTIETTVNNHSTAIGKETDSTGAATGIYARIEALEAEDIVLDGRLDTAETDINNLEAADTRIEGKVDQNTTDITGLKTTTGKLSTDLTALTTRVTTAEGEIDQLQLDVDAAEAALGTSGDSSSQNTAFGRIKKLEETDVTHAVDIKAAAEKANSNATDISGLKTRMDEAESGISTNAEAIEALQEAIGDGTGLTGRIETLESSMTTAQSDITTLKSDLDKAEETISSHGTKIGTLETATQNNATNITNLTTTVNGHTTNITNLQTAHDELEDRVEANETAIGKTTDSVDTAKTGSLYARTNKNADDIASLGTRVGTLETSVSTLNGDENVTGSVKQQIKLAKEALQAEIDRDINAANAMNYIGGVNGTAALPTSNVKVGDTYVVTSAFKLTAALAADGEETNCYAGDLLIAVGTEDATTGFITSGLKWTYVNTGYINEHEAKLTGAGNQILLTSHTALTGDEGDLGKITFAAATDSSATVSVANNTVTIGIEWGTF